MKLINVNSNFFIIALGRVIGFKKNNYISNQLKECSDETLSIFWKSAHMKN